MDLTDVVNADVPLETFPLKTVTEAADDRVTLENEDAFPLAREKRRRRKSAEAGSDDYRVERFFHLFFPDPVEVFGVEENRALERGDLGIG